MKPKNKKAAKRAKHLKKQKVVEAAPTSTMAWLNAQPAKTEESAKSQYQVDYYRTSQLKAEAKGGTEATTRTIIVEALNRPHALAKAKSPHRHLIDAYKTEPCSEELFRARFDALWQEQPIVETPDLDKAPEAPEPEPPAALEASTPEINDGEVTTGTPIITAAPNDGLDYGSEYQAEDQDDEQSMPILFAFQEPPEDDDDDDGDDDFRDEEDYGDEYGEDLDDIEFPSGYGELPMRHPDDEPSTRIAILRIVTGGIAGILIGLVVGYLLFYPHGK